MKKILLFILMAFPLIISGCSCDKFDINTYVKAVDNFKDSTGYEYTLKITTKVEGQENYVREDFHNKYILKQIIKYY